MPTPLTWGATVDEVSALAPHITIKANPAEPLSTDPVFGATVPRAVTVKQVESFIEDVAARVDIRIIRMSKITDEAVRERFARAAHDLTVQGAGSYLVAAAFPAKAGLNDQSSLSAELWARFTSGLDNLVTAVTEYTDPEGGAEPSGGYPANANEGWFQNPLFPDVPQTGPGGRDCPYPGSWAGW